MARETLQQQFERLSKPEKDFDIEDHDLKPDAFGDEGSDSESSEADEAAKRDHYVSVGESLLRKAARGAVKLNGKYEGSAVSREDLYNQESDDYEQSEEQDDEAEDVDDEEEEEEESDEENVDDESDSGASLRANSDSESDAESDAELAHKRNKLKQLMSGEKKHIVSRLSQAGTNDALKGYAILQQNKVFDSLIDTRMKIQPAVASSNLLPANVEVMQHEHLESSKTEKYISKAKEACYDLLDSVHALRQQLLDVDAVSSTQVQMPKKRKLATYLSTAEAFDAILNKYRQSVLVKWSAKIQNTSGSSAINSGKFKVINQSAEQQVQNNLMDMDRLLKRTRMNRRQVVPLGHEYYMQQQEQEQSGKGHNVDGEENEDDEDENVDIPKSEKSDKDGIQQIDTIFDDDDFYRLLLNDLVDRKIQAQNPTSGLSITMRSAKSAARFKKNVDTKASKGRKLRYQVQEPIANFETSTGSWKWGDEQIDEFFASLLGQKVDMAEADAEDAEDAEDMEDSTIAEDGIRLFG